MSVFQNGEIYVNGEHRGKLTADQTEQLDNYMKDSSEWSIKMQKGMYEQIETSINAFMQSQRQLWSRFTPTTEHKEEVVKDLSPQHLSKNVAMPIAAPKPPAFCIP